MSIRDRITRALRAPGVPAVDDRPRTEVEVCDGCGARPELDESGRLPYGWFPFSSGELLCPLCLVPTLAMVRQFWDHDAVTRGEQG